LKALNENYWITACQVIQANLADVGIKVDIIPVDSGPFWDMGLEEKGDTWKTLQLWLMRYRCSPDPADPIQWFVKSQVGIWNWERWSDPEFEELWTKGLGEPDAEKRAAMYVRMQEIMEDTGAYFWITHDPVFYAHKSSLVPAYDPGGEIMAERCRSA
jgi:peptide/nickel transport system substrate-binding protein